MSPERPMRRTLDHPLEGGSDAPRPDAPPATIRMTITVGHQVLEIPPFEVPSRILVALQSPTFSQTGTTAESSLSPAAEPLELDKEERSLAAKVFELLTALDPDKRLRKAPPIKVFNLYYRQGLQPAEIAHKCKCHRSLIFDRLAAIKKRLPWTPEQLRELSPQVEDMEEAVRDSRARSICRKHAFSGDEDRDGRVD